MTSVKEINLRVDDRERNADLLDVLQGMEDIEVERVRLEVGDFQIGNAVLIERKTAADFAASLIDGRLFSQASRMIRAPMRPCYIIEGTPEDWKGLNVQRPSLQGALISLMLIFDIPVLRSNDPAETARLVRYTAQQLHRANSDGYVPTRMIKAKRRTTRQRRVLQSLPGVGPDRAKRLLEHFGSVRACLAADVDELSDIPGIGPNTAQRIVETVEEDAALYGNPPLFP